MLGKIHDSKDNNFGYNALTGEFEDLVKAGVLDPTKVTRTALQNAGSIASLMLTTEALVAEIPEEKKAPAMRRRTRRRHGRHVLRTALSYQLSAFRKSLTRESGAFSFATEFSKSLKSERHFVMSHAENHDLGCLDERCSGLTRLEVHFAGRACRDDRCDLLIPDGDPYLCHESADANSIDAPD